MFHHVGPASRLKYHLNIWQGHDLELHGSHEICYRSLGHNLGVSKYCSNRHLRIFLSSLELLLLLVE